MSTTVRRVTTAVTVGPLTAALATTPATALRLVPTDPTAGAGALVEPSENPALLMSVGRLAAHLASERDPAGSGQEGGSESLIMSGGRLLG